MRKLLLLVLLCFAAMSECARVELREMNSNHAVILIDASASVSANNSTTPYIIKSALKDVYDAHFPKRKGLAMALFECATHATMVADWTSTSQHGAIHDAIDKLKFNNSYEESFTNWEACLKAVSKKAEAEGAGYPFYVYFITDGNPTTHDDLAGPPPSDNLFANVDRAVAASKELQKNGAQVLPIGVGPRVSDAYLKKIAGPCVFGCVKNWHYLHVDSYDNLSGRMRTAMRFRGSVTALLQKQHPRLFSVDAYGKWVTFSPDGMMTAYGRGALPLLRDLAGQRPEVGTPIAEIFPEDKANLNSRIFSNALRGTSGKTLRLSTSSGKVISAEFTPLLNRVGKRDGSLADDVMLGNIVELKYAEPTHNYHTRTVYGSGLCTEDLVANPDCGANDFTFVEFDAVRVDGNDTCMEGEMITVNISMVVDPTANMRFDIGFQIALDGGTGVNGTCANSGLFPVSMLNDTDIDLMSGVGPYYNGEVDEVGDICGDADKAHGLIRVNFTGLTVPCTIDVNGSMTIGVVISWSTTPHTSTNPCTGPDETGPQTSSKCQQNLHEVKGITPIPNSTTAPPTTTTESTTTTSGSTTTTSGSTTTTPPPTIPPEEMTSCTGHVWFDVDGNGIQYGEPNFEGITVRITDEGMTTFVAVSDINGAYFIPTIATGAAQIMVDVPYGFRVSSPSSSFSFAIPLSETTCSFPPIGLTNASEIIKMTPSPSSGLSTGQIVGIVIGVVLFVILLTCLCIGLNRRAIGPRYTRQHATIIDLREDPTPVVVRSQIQSKRSSRRQSQRNEVRQRRRL